jgi:hypothetical protein
VKAGDLQWVRIPSGQSIARPEATRVMKYQAAYQSPDFYRKLGYQVAGKLEDWDSHEHMKYFFTKKLIAPNH